MAIRIPPVRYVTLFPGRTGSTYLTDHLSNHPNIVANYEILSQYQESWEQQEEFLRTMVQTRRDPKIVAIGLKSKVRDILNWDEFEKLIKSYQFRIIYLSRRNQLKLVVSVVRADLLRQQCGVSNLISQEYDDLGPTIIPLDRFEKARKRIRRQLRLQRMVQRLQLPTLEISYEELLVNERGVLNQVWDFLDVPRVLTTGRTRKNTPHDLRSAVLNLEEILEHYPEMKSFVDRA